MPAFRVVFEADVIYMPGHPKAQRVLRFLNVWAPDAEHAKAHALRTTTGGLIASVEDVGDFVGPAPAVEVGQ